MSQNSRSQHNSRSDRFNERNDSNARIQNISNQRMRPEGEQDVQRGRGSRVVDWTSRLSPIDYDRNAE